MSAQNWICIVLAIEIASRVGVPWWLIVLAVPAGCLAAAIDESLGAPLSRWHDAWRRRRQIRREIAEMGEDR